MKNLQTLSREETDRSEHLTETLIKTSNYKMVEVSSKEKDIYKDLYITGISINFNAAEAEKELVKIIRDGEYEDKNLFEPEAFYGLLDSLVSKHTKILANIKGKKEVSILLREITRLVLQQAIAATWSSTDRILYPTSKNNDPTNKQAIYHISNALYGITITDVPKLVEKRIEKWYKDISSERTLNVEKYLTHARMQFQQRMFSFPDFRAILMRDLKLFVDKLDLDSTETLDLFSKRDDGVYNLDYILNLVMSERNNLARYCENEDLHSAWPHSRDDLILICELYKHQKLVTDVFFKVYSLTDSDRDYIDIIYLIYINRYNEVKKVKNPTEACNIERTDTVYTVPLLEETAPEFRKRAESYIKERAHFIRDLIDSHGSKKSKLTNIKRGSWTKANAYMTLGIFSMIMLCSTSSLIVANAN